jgi:hypothetical protein
MTSSNGSRETIVILRETGQQAIYQEGNGILEIHNRHTCSKDPLNNFLESCTFTLAKQMPSFISPETTLVSININKNT